MSDFKITLANDKVFSCASGSTIFESAAKAGIHLEHSCLNARCSSCITQVIEGSTINAQEEFVLSESEKADNYILTCNAIPQSDVKLSLEDLGDIQLFEKKIFPSKIDAIDYLTNDVVKISLRLPPRAAFQFNAGQYVNLIKNGISRSYSLANSNPDRLEFFIKNYPGGQMSHYWFEEAKVNDLIRVEGPLGTFFLRDAKCDTLIFLATGTGIAPIKAILDDMEAKNLGKNYKSIWVFNGNRFENDLFWKPEYDNLNVAYVPVLSRETGSFDGVSGYVQQAVLSKGISLANAQVYACGSSVMINDSKTLFLQNGLKENNFFSDAFVQTN